MNKAVLRPVLLLVVGLIGCASRGGGPREWKNPVVTSPFLDAKEVYFEIDPRRRAAYLRGYAPSVLDAGESAGHFERMKGLIREGRFCQEIFNFESMKSVGERIRTLPIEGKDVPVFECRVEFIDKALDLSLEDFLSHVSRRELSVLVGPEEIGVNYSDGPIALSSHNASSHLFLKNREGEVIRNVIFWKTGLDRYYGVIGNQDKAYSLRLDADLFRTPVSSPGFRD